MLGAVLFAQLGNVASPGDLPAGLTCKTSAGEIAFSSPWLRIAFPTGRPGVSFLSVDAAGNGTHDRNFLDDERGIDLFETGSSRQLAAPNVLFKLTRSGNVISYADIGIPLAGGTATILGDLTFTVEPKGLKVAFDGSTPSGLTGLSLRALFDVGRVVATPLGRTVKPGTLQFPVLFHLVDHGSLLVRCKSRRLPVWQFTADQKGRRIELALSPVSGVRRTELDMQATEIYPERELVDADPKLAGVKRGWMNIFGFRPDRPCLGNNVVSDQAMFCMYEYADQALYTPPLFKGLTALDLVRTSLDYYFDGGLGYGKDSGVFQDTDPAIVISAWDYATGRRDLAWLKRRLPDIEKYAYHIVACQPGPDELPQSTRHGISGSGPDGAGEWSSNWWDVVSFGGNDAYSIALDYRAFRCMSDIERRCGNPDKEKFFAARAQGIKDLYFKTFFNPATGILAGWRSTDGKLHDYWFTFVNGIAISYGLVPREQADAIMTKFLAKMREVGYTNFKIGLPGNLIPVLRKDYAGGGVFGQPYKDDGSDSFQSYQNGGATGGFAYFTLQALYSLGRTDDADRIFDAMLQGYEDGVFQDGIGSGVDWKRWDGTPCGYEGLLTDSYYALTALITGKLGRGVPIP